MRLMSFSMTESKMVSREKTVTRRRGWQNLRVGEVLCAVDKAMGLRKGEHPRTIGFIRVLSLRRERLDAITDDDVAREGYPGMSPAEFVERFSKAMKCGSREKVTRIEFEHVGRTLEEAQRALAEA